MVSLKNYIETRIQQLKDRKNMIPRYLERPGSFLGKKDFSLDDIPKIEADIKECEAALKAIEALKKGKELIYLNQ